MNEKVRIEVDEQTAEALKARAAARGMTVSALVAELIGAEETMPPDLQVMRDAGEGPWAPQLWPKTRAGLPNSGARAKPCPGMM